MSLWTTLQPWWLRVRALCVRSPAVPNAVAGAAAPVEAATGVAAAAAPAASEERRHSRGARLFHGLLVVLGIRVPYQSLYEPNETVMVKVMRLCSPCRLYSLAVLVSLCMLPVKHVIDMSHEYNDLILISLVSELILPIQFLLAVRYFGSTHLQSFYDVMKPARLPPRTQRDESHIREIFVDLQERASIADALDFNLVIKSPCKITIRIVSYIIIFIGLTSFVVALWIEWMAKSVSNFYYPFFVISRLHGRTTCVVNTAGFAFVFYKHVKVLSYYGNILESRDWSSQSYEEISLMLLSLMRIRESLSQSTQMTKLIFTSATIVGAIIMGAFVHSNAIAAASDGERSAAVVTRWSYESFILVGSFVLLQLILFTVIAKLSYEKERIEDVTKSSAFAKKFLVRSAPATESHQAAIDTATTIDYWLIVDVLRQPWLDFSVMGVPLHSMAFIKQSVSLASIILILANTQTIHLPTLISTAG